jgi:NAD(P)-dependent dehydrogenase (short-subunit alcohol dehydrogenase family)
MDTSDNTYIIAGASSGIGLEIARKLIADNIIYCISRTPGELEYHENFRHIAYDFF